MGKGTTQCLSVVPFHGHLHQGSTWPLLNCPGLSVSMWDQGRLPWSADALLLLLLLLLLAAPLLYYFRWASTTLLTPGGLASLCSHPLATVCSHLFPHFGDVPQPTAAPIQK
jgi:hypothetical protein